MDDTSQDDIRTTTTRLRIDFVIQEVPIPGTPHDPAAELRYVKFGEDVSLDMVRDFFDRITAAASMLFQQTVGTQTMSFVSLGPNKIQLIKLVREAAGLGLREAKDLVESPLGTPIMIMHELSDVKRSREAFNGAGAKIEIRPYRTTDADLRDRALPTLPTARWP